MKKVLNNIIITGLCFFLSGCALTNAYDSEHESEHPSTHDSEEQISEEEPSSTSEPTGEMSYYLEFANSIYATSTFSELDFIAVEEDTSIPYRHESEPFKIENYTSQIKFPDNEFHDIEDPFNVAGTYIFTSDVKVIRNGHTYKLKSRSFEVLSGFINHHFDIVEATYSDLSFNPGDYFLEALDKDINFRYTNGRSETYHLLGNDDYFTYSLTVDGDDEDVINLPLEGNTRYSYEIKLVIDEEVLYTIDGTFFVEDPGYYRLSQNDITVVNSDINYAYAPAKGDVKMFVIPISLTCSSGYSTDWDEESLQKISDYFFGDEGITMKTYYHQASLGQMEVSGIVSETYVETDGDYSIENILSNGTYTLFDLIARAVTWVENSYPDIDFSEYDLNDDGCLDNVHLVTNFDTKKYRDITGESPWGVTLWPHKSQTGNVGTLANPVANVYSINAIDHLTDAITAIHEQGHIFGLTDYYDYSNSGIDYIGYADMQSYNIFDWNSFSKFSCGWVSPYVVTNECTITINPAATSGDFIVVPANPNTYNNSAFDEYFLIELFTNCGNNAAGPYNNYNTMWSYWSGGLGISSNFNNLSNGGVRLYHVDARLYDYSLNGIVDKKTDEYSNVTFACDNNAYDHSRSSRLAPYADYKLLSIIQRGGIDTFGVKVDNPDDFNELKNNHHFLGVEDLFVKGNVFTFNNYKHFLSKTGQAVSTMDNGESFPYTITFDNVSTTSATITFTKI